MAKRQAGSGFRRDRRNLIIGGAGLLMGLSLRPGTAEAAGKPDRLPPQVGDRLMITKGAHKEKLLRPELLAAGAGQLEGFPFGVEDGVLRKRNRFNRLLFLRVERHEIDADVAHHFDDFWMNARTRLRAGRDRVCLHRIGELVEQRRGHL